MSFPRLRSRLRSSHDRPVHQPFGGARASGTNDKAGSVLNLLRWVSPRAIKETFVPAVDYRYPHMG
jgi:1-pyrroline-5-carboxylate dehydrogenase